MSSRDRSAERSSRFGIQVASKTDVGRVRRQNEDFLGVETTTLGLVAIVCDGMGGHAAGDRASRIAVETFRRSLAPGDGEIAQRLRRAAEEANQAVLREAASSPDLDGMGTTLVAAVVQDQSVDILNVGDSRAYLIRDASISQISHDHSLVGELIRRGELTAEDAATHPQRNVITQALGTSERIEPDLFSVELRIGDRLLLCTDGLHGMLGDADIRRIIEHAPTVEAACDRLIAAALENGGLDNVSVVLLQMVDSDRPLQSPIHDPDTLPPSTSTDATDANPPAAPDPDDSMSGPVKGVLAIVIAGLTAAIIWLSSRPSADPIVDPRDSVATMSADSLRFQDSLPVDSAAQLTPFDEVSDAPRSGIDSVRPDSIAIRTDTSPRAPGAGRNHAVRP